MNNLPEGWRWLALGEVTREESLRVGRRQEVKVLSSTKHHGLVPSDQYFKNRTIYSSDLSNYKLVPRNCFAYATNHLAEGSIGLQSQYDLACVSPVYTVFSCDLNQVDENYMFRLLKSPPLMVAYGAHEQASVDRRGAIRYRDFSRIYVLLPTKAEQRRIAEILDALDTQISATQACVEKYRVMRYGQVRDIMQEELSELAGVEVSEVVRRAANGNGPLRVLDDLIVYIDAGSSPSVDDVPAGPGEWGVLKVSAIGRGVFRPQENKVARDKALHVASYCVRDGDLLISRANTPELVGSACVVRNTPPRLMLSDKTLRLHLNDALASCEYVNLMLGVAEVRRQIEVAATGTSGSMKNISQESIRKLVIPWAGKEKRNLVTRMDAAYLEQIEALTRQITALGHLKQGLAEDLLTGRVRVPEAEAVVESL